MYCQVDWAHHDVISVRPVRYVRSLLEISNLERTTIPTWDRGIFWVQLWAYSESTLWLWLGLLALKLIDFYRRQVTFRRATLILKSRHLWLLEHTPIIHIGQPRESGFQCSTAVNAFPEVASTVHVAPNQSRWWEPFMAGLRICIAKRF